MENKNVNKLVVAFFQFIGVLGTLLIQIAESELGAMTKLGITFAGISFFSLMAFVVTLLIDLRNSTGEPLQQAGKKK